MQISDSIRYYHPYGDTNHTRYVIYLDFENLPLTSRALFDKDFQSILKDDQAYSLSAYSANHTEQASLDLQLQEAMMELNIITTTELHILVLELLRNTPNQILSYTN